MISNHRRYRRPLATLAGLAVLAPLLLVVQSQAPSVAADAPEALGNLLGDAQGKSSMKTPAQTERSRQATLAVAPAEWELGDTVTFNVFDGVSINGVVNRVTPRTTDGLAYRSWVGALNDGGTFEAVEVDGAQLISVHSREGAFQVLNDTDERAALVVEFADGPAVTEHDDAIGTLPEAPKSDVTVPPSAPSVEAQAGDPNAVDSAPGLARKRARPTFPPPTVWTSARGNISFTTLTRMTPIMPAGDSAAVIDELIIVTPDAYALLGGTDSAVEAKLSIQVTRVNEMLANSAIPSRVHATWIKSPVQQPNGRTLLQEYTALAKSNDGYLDDLTSARRANKFDHVTVFAERPTGDRACGWGTLGGSDYISLSVIGHTCLEGPSVKYSYTHEFGHNLSAQHDRGAEQSPSNTAYAYGYVDPGKRFRTVMSYETTCSYQVHNCAWLNRFSSATQKINWGGQATAIGNATTDNRRAALGWSRKLANVAPSKIYPGEIAIVGDSRLIQANAWAGLPWSARRSFAWYVGKRLVSRKATYVPKAKQNGKWLKLVVTYSAPGYASVRKSTTKWKIMRVKGTRFSGRGKVGNVLRVYAGRKAVKGQKMKVVWKRGNKTVGKKSSYRLKRADAGKTVYALVTYRAKRGLGFTTSVVWSGIWR